ncbi:hypothetical protein [Suttonella ornithocola]|uniref:Uncharacterized protein n=1 Tax=Suttonella ornithocola TaxID=279832 RepID=A0A380MR65_9GAMM|nr:hypothetical protein [Suttonella ornithocola]SUO94546.1 Uncharacterised protein [Suttonella ornithocola]
MQSAFEKPITTAHGSYAVYADTSGGQLWLQTDNQNTIIGLNPHFSGFSRFPVHLTEFLPGNNAMDGAFYAWLNPNI